MKKWAFALLGLFLAGMAITAMFHDVIGIVIGVFLAVGAWRSFRAAGRSALERAEVPAGRPWER